LRKAHKGTIDEASMGKKYAKNAKQKQSCVFLPSQTEARNIIGSWDQPLAENELSG
jgi:hypothetical protein